MNIHDKITTIEQQLTELREKAKNCKPVFWEPKNNEKAWYVSCGTLEIRSARSWSQDEIATGIGYKTKELAEQSLELQLATQRLKKAIFYFNEGKEYPFEFGVPNHYVELRYTGLLSSSLINLKHCPNWFYMKDKEACKKLIESHSDDLHIYLGG
ncbi:MAG: hypothetical protein U9Q40_06790 [Campylobacterota bacterium]|nr:hypothetical protein [Campylobacterota bacterium]